MKTDISEAVAIFSMLSDTLAEPPRVLAGIRRFQDQKMHRAIRDEGIESLLGAVGVVEGHPVAGFIRRRVELVAPSVLAEEDAPAILAWANSESLQRDAEWWAELAALSPEYAGELLNG